MFWMMMIKEDWVGRTRAWVCVFLHKLTLYDPLVNLSSRRVWDFVEERLSFVTASCDSGIKRNLS